MAIYVHNGSATTMYVALAYHSPGCEGDNWAKKGWWAIAPGGRATVRGGASNGAKYFWYAENDGGQQRHGKGCDGRSEDRRDAPTYKGRDQPESNEVGADDENFRRSAHVEQ